MYAVIAQRYIGEATHMQRELRVLIVNADDYSEAMSKAKAQLPPGYLIKAGIGLVFWNDVAIAVSNPIDQYGIHFDRDEVEI